MQRYLWIVVLSGTLLGQALPQVWAASGDEGAAFLEIPVGAGPAAMGGAYTALANDAYAATWNPGGLGMTESTQFAGQHLEYLDSIHYEYLSFALPFRKGSALGGSVQYLGSGDITGRDLSGNSTGDFSSYYAAYNLAYGHNFLDDKLALGLTGKMIHAKIDDVSASAYAADLGGLYLVNPKLTLGATVTNIGTSLKFLNEGDSLPLEFHAGVALRPARAWLLSGELVYPMTGLTSVHVGGEWRPLEMLSLRTGYRTDTVKGLSALAGYSLGFGIHAWGQELAYAWLPYGDLGNTHYISLLAKFGEAEKSKRNLIQYQHIKSNRGADASDNGPETQQLMELLNSEQQGRQAQQSGTEGNLK